MGKEKAILLNLFVFNSALPSRLLLQQDSNKGRHHPPLTQPSICLPWWRTINTKVKVLYPSLNYPSCRFKIHQFAALSPGSSKNSRGKPISY